MELSEPKKKKKKIEEKGIDRKTREKEKKEISLGEKIFNFFFGNVSEDLVYGPIPFLWRLYKY